MEEQEVKGRKANILDLWSITTKSEITAEMAYEGVSNYCHSAYDYLKKEN